MMTQLSTMVHGPGKSQSVLINVPSRTQTIRIGTVISLAALAYCSSSPGAGGIRLDLPRLNASGAGAPLYARDEDTSFDVSTALSEIRKFSGLTWSQLAKVFGVSRRAVHSWATGLSEVRLENAARVEEVLTLIRSMRSEPVFKIRNKILSVAGLSLGAEIASSGQSPIMMSDARPLSSGVPRRSTSKMKVQAR